jgi:hypothetical protein
MVGSLWSAKVKLPKPTRGLGLPESHYVPLDTLTEQLDEVYRAYDALDASAIVVNDHTALRDDAMPFAGLNEGLNIPTESLVQGYQLQTTG